MSGSITLETSANDNADTEQQQQEEEEEAEQDPAMLEMEKALQEIERIVEENKRLSLQRRKAVFASCQIILGGNIADFQQGVRATDRTIKKSPSLRSGPNGEVDKYYAMSLSIMSRSDRFESVFDAVKGVTRNKTPLTRLCDEYKMSTGLSSSSSLSNSQSLDSLRGRKTVDNGAIRPSMSSTPKRNASWGQSPSYWKDAANAMDSSNHNKNNKNANAVVEPRVILPQRNVPTAKTA
jgi:hypothetical protein